MPACVSERAELWLPPGFAYFWIASRPLLLRQGPWESANPGSAAPQSNLLSMKKGTEPHGGKVTVSWQRPLWLG